MTETLGDIKVSIIVPIHHIGPMLFRCMRALENYAKEAFEIVLVLDGISLSSDLEKLAASAGCKVEKLTQNLGPAVARNEGAAIASGHVLFFLDSDVEIRADTLERIKTQFSSPDTPNALIGSYDALPSERTLISKYRNLLHHHTHQMASEGASTFWGACGAIKREVFLTVGGFNTSFHKSSVEDIELGYRLVQDGYRIKLDKQLQVKHLKKWTFWNMIKTDVFHRARPWTQLLYQYQKRPLNDLNINHRERLATAFLDIGIICSILSSFWSFLLLFGIASLLSLILIKGETYRFFGKKFKWYQMPIVVLLHWIYLACAQLGFVIGTVDWFISLKRKVQPPLNHEKTLALNE